VFKIGIDLGGTKTEGVLLDEDLEILNENEFLQSKITKRS